MTASDNDHEVEIERDGKRRRASCECGFLGPWRLTRRTALNDGDAHLERRAETDADPARSER